MRTEFLSDWERAAVVESVRAAVSDGRLDKLSGESLLRKLDAASHVRLSYLDERPTIAPQTVDMCWIIQSTSRGTFLHWDYDSDLQMAPKFRWSGAMNDPDYAKLFDTREEAEKELAKIVKHPRGRGCQITAIHRKV